jgi:drug/metabolite transporter (DMT)-like permease
MSDPLSGAIFAALASTSWAAGACFARVGMQQVGSRSGTVISLAAGFVTISVVAWVMDSQALFAVSRSTVLWFALLGLIQFPGGRFLNYTGIRLAGVARATSISGSSPLFAALLAIVFLGERVTFSILLGTLAVAVGLALVMSQRGQSQEVQPSKTGRVAIGLLCAVAGAAAYGTSHVIARHIVTSSAPAPVTATYTLFFGMLFLLVVSVPHLNRDLRAPRWALIMMILAGICSSFGIFLMYNALARAPVILASPIVATYPLIAMTLTHVFLQRLERVTLRMVLGAILVAVGIIFVVLGQA